jgi:hypothetical protein
VVALSRYRIACAERENTVEPKYTIRTHTLQPNVPVSLPPGAEYTLLTATDDTNLQISVGDNNAEFAQWLYGIKLSFEPPVPTRIVSSVAQRISVLITGGGVYFDDTRYRPVVISGQTMSLRVGGAVTASGVIVPQLSNVNGVEVLGCTVHLKSTAALSAICGLRGGTVDIFTGVVRSVDRDHQYTLPYPLFLQPGVEFGWTNYTNTEYLMQITYKVN